MYNQCMHTQRLHQDALSHGSPVHCVLFKRCYRWLSGDMYKKHPCVLCTSLLSKDNMFFHVSSWNLFTTSRNTVAWLLVYTCLGIDVKTLKLVLARQWAGVWLGIGWPYLTRRSAISLTHARAASQHRKYQITHTITKFSDGLAHALSAPKRKLMLISGTS